MAKKIVIGSVLKPVNDVRMYEKIAISLSTDPGYEIYVAGFKGEVKNAPSNVHIQPLFNFPRLSFSRFFAPWKFYKYLIQVKPEYILVTTHELLAVSCIYKIIFGGKILYDVQENYFRNIAFTGTFPPIIRQVLAFGVRLKEVLTRPLIAHYFLAEKNYEKEFSFSKGKSTILENKARKAAVLSASGSKPKDRIRLLYSGTIAEVYGVFEAIDLAVQLHELDARIELKIIGYSSKNEVFEDLLQRIKPYPFIQLTGGNQLVPHDQILKEIASAHFGLVSYRSNKSTKNCIPTKVYEYLAFQLPMIVQENPLWEEVVTHYQAGIMTDFMKPDPSSILKAMKETSFYKASALKGIYWEDEEHKLQSVLKALS